MRSPNRFLLPILISIYVKCNEVEKYTGFNDKLREYSNNESKNVSSSDNIKTLQTEKVASYAHFVPSQNPIKYKDISDNALATTSHIKSYSQHSKIGYALHDYDEHGHDQDHYGYGYDYYNPNIHDLDHHGHGPYLDHDLHHSDHGHHNHHHHKHYNHAIATKAVLWPIAGLALLGAAAALVSNPILLQLGVVSGKRRRRDTEEITGPDFKGDFLKKLHQNVNNRVKKSTESRKDPYVSTINNEAKKKLERRALKKKITKDFLIKEHRKHSNFLSLKVDEDRFVPIPLEIRP